jgi:anti-sigma B factor antagonist
MQIAEQRQGAVTVVGPQGPLCLGDADQFRAHVTEVMERSLGRFVVDAAAIPYVDSKGLEALVALTEALGESGRALKLCGACETVREILDLTELSPLFEHFEDVNTAVRSFL